ncbi:MAG TPA: hypothetical protein VG013_17910 [Gemmataceae bacterium]|nr:hypothetical protein [Gemmataceae bacterium]
MRLLGWSIGAWLAALLLAGGEAPARADAPPDPLRLVPKEADLVVAVPQPRRLVEAFTTLDVIKQLQQFDQVRELVDSTTYRRFYQLIAYYEKQFGLKWPELLDRLAGGGAVLAVKLGPDPAPGLIVVQSKDEQLLKKLTKAALDVLEQELARQESKERPEKVVYRNIETVHVGKGLYAAVAGSALLISNNETALRRSLDLHLDRSKKSLAGHAGVGEARKLLPPDPLAWLWLNMETVHKAPQAKEVFMLPRNDVNLTVAFGSVLDIAGRSPFLCAGFYRQKDGFLTTVRMPRGREGMTPALSMHVAPAGRPAALPLLEPPSVIFSESFYLDISKYWEDRPSCSTPSRSRRSRTSTRTRASSSWATASASLPPRPGRTSVSSSPTRPRPVTRQCRRSASRRSPWSCRCASRPPSASRSRASCARPPSWRDSSTRSSWWRRRTATSRSSATASPRTPASRQT